MEYLIKSKKSFFIIALLLASLLFSNFYSNADEGQATRIYLETKVFLSDAKSNHETTSYTTYSYYNPLILYQCNGEYYANFHDIAYILKNTYSAFDIRWNDALSRTEILLHTNYSRNREITEENFYDSPRSLNPWWAKVNLWIEDKPNEVTGFVYNKQLFVSMGELSKIIGFSVEKKQKTVELIYEMSKDKMDSEQVKEDYLAIMSELPDNIRLLNDKNIRYNESQVKYDDRWSQIKTNYLYRQGNGFVAVYAVKIEKYDVPEEWELYASHYDSNWKLIKTQKLNIHGERFGGFYHGEKYNYFVFGNDNPKEDNNKAVLSIVKTNHDFKEMKKADVKNCYTVIPFDAGSLSMSEYKNSLIIHTARERYRTPDGLNHQSQLTVAINTEDMRVVNSKDLGRFQINHVSHSFNQFVLHDASGNVYLVDHGDAYPRSIVLHKLDAKMKNLNKKIDVFKIKGKTGANQTGVYIGDVEQSASHILIGANQIDFNKATSFDSFDISGKDVNRRDIYVHSVHKDSGKKMSLRLTDYSKDEGNTTYSAPQIIKIDEDKFAVIWMKKTFDSSEHSYLNSEILQYVLIDGSGKKIGEIKTVPWNYIGNGKSIYHDGYIYSPLYSVYGAMAVNRLKIE